MYDLIDILDQDDAMTDLTTSLAAITSLDATKFIMGKWFRATEPVKAEAPIEEDIDWLGRFIEGRQSVKHHQNSSIVPA